MAKQRVLVVDDSQVNLKVTRVLLVTAGYEVVTALSTDEVGQKLTSFRPQLLILGVGTGAANGLSLIRNLKTSPEWRALPIIALTAPEMVDAEEAALAAGSDSWLSKPVDATALRNLVRQHLEGGPAASTPAPPAAPAGDAEDDPFAEQRAEFRRRGAQDCRRMLAVIVIPQPKRTLAPLMDHQELRKIMHSWAGLGGTLGFPQITEYARAGELLLSKPLEEIAAPLRRIVEDLLDQFMNATPVGVKRTVPQTSSPQAPAPAPGPAAPARSEAVEQKPILLIGEDDPIVSSMIKTTLEKHFECRIADNGRLAFAMARNNPPDVMILDVNMPNMDGFQVLEELRRLETTRKLPVMLLTARHEPADIRRGVHLGVNDYMVKPFDPAELLDRVCKLLAF